MKKFQTLQEKTASCSRWPPGLINAPDESGIESGTLKGITAASKKPRAKKTQRKKPALITVDINQYWSKKWIPILQPKSRTGGGSLYSEPPPKRDGHREFEEHELHLRASCIVSKLGFATGWKPAVRPQWQLSPPLKTASVCQQQITASGPFSTISFFSCSANKSSLPLRWHELFSVATTTPPNQTQKLEVEWAQSQHSKELWTNQSTWTRHTARPTQRNLKSLLFWLICYPSICFAWKSVHWSWNEVYEKSKLDKMKT